MKVKLPPAWEWHVYKEHGVSERWLVHRGAVDTYVCIDCAFTTHNTRSLAGHNRQHPDKHDACGCPECWDYDPAVLAGKADTLTKRYW